MVTTCFFQLEIDHFFKQDFNIGIASQYPANRRRDLARGKPGRGDLVEQRLESVMISSVNDRYLNRKTGDPARRRQPPKTGPHNDYARLGLAFHALWLHSDSPI